MTPARKLTTPPPPASHTRTKVPPRSLDALRVDAHRLLARADDEVRALRIEADAMARPRCLTDDAHADSLDVRARALQADADELRWLASLAP